MLAADWHGNTPWAEAATRLAGENGASVIYQVGDFCEEDENEGSDYRDSLQAVLAEYDMTMIVTPGNHEHYGLLETWPKNEYGFIVDPKRPSIWYAPRGHVWTHCGLIIASMGGAYSIDRRFRKENVSWWSQEEITTEDLDNLRLNLNGDTVDLFLTHDYPEGSKPEPVGFAQLPYHLIEGSLRQRLRIRQACEEARPRVLIHGHWHQRITGELKGDGDYSTKVLGLSADGDVNNVQGISDLVGFIEETAASHS